MVAYMDLTDVPAGDVQMMRLALEASLHAPDNSDAALDAVNELVRLADGPRHMTIVWARTLLFAVASAADTAPVEALLRLAIHTLRAAEDVKFELELDGQLEHSLSHGPSGGGPDPDCPYCDPEEDA